MAASTLVHVVTLFGGAREPGRVPPRLCETRTLQVHGAADGGRWRRDVTRW